MTSNNLVQLRELLKRAPVMGNIHPLIPLCLASDTEVSVDAQSVVREMDAISPHPARSLLIRGRDSRYEHRFLTMDIPEPPDAGQVSSTLPKRLSYARKWLLNNRDVANRITDEANVQRYQTVITLLVDGLSYYDVLYWPEVVEPCFIDGPTITFDRFVDNTVRTDVGFPAIIGDPPLVRRLAKIGVRYARGFSYWHREDNDVTELLYRGIPLERITSIDEAITAIEAMDTSGLYIQIVREGLDGLAHGRREVSEQEIESTVEAIRADMQQLVKSLQAQRLRSALYLVADHGILWKKQHEFKLQPMPGSRSARYGNIPLTEGRSTPFSCQEQMYYLYHYPYIGRRIRSNDSGVHGGLSGWESLVPFVRVEVIP